MLRSTLTACLVVVLLAPAAARAEASRLSGAYGPADIERACRSAGGTPIGIAGVSYGCKTENCDGKGGTCSVECTDPQHCLATTPTRIVVPTTLLGLLQNGDMVVRAPRGGGGSLRNSPPIGNTSGGDTKPTDGALY